MKKAKYFHDSGWIGHPDIYFKDDISISLNYSIINEPGKYNVAVIVEPESILHGMNVQLFKNDFAKFDLVLTWQDEIIKSNSNARFLPFGTAWVDEKNLTGNKQDKVSFLTSNKISAPGHQMRHRIYSLFSHIQDVNGMPYKQTMTPPRINRKEELLDEYKFSIIIENERQKNWFTEKLIDCFVSKTIPIYWGCTNIDEFFDTNGMIIVENESELLKQMVEFVKPGEYEKRLDAVENNYKLSHNYKDFYKNLEDAINKHFYGKVK